MVSQIAWLRRGICSVNKIPLSSDFDFDDHIKGILYNDRILTISGEIDEYYGSRVSCIIDSLSTTSEDIHILLTSYGGAVEAGGAIIRSIRQAQINGCNILGEVRGYAMSMAAVILQACDTRFAALEDVVMVHGITSVTMGDIRNQEADVSLAKKLMDIHAAFYAGRNTSKDDKYHDKIYWRSLLDDNFPHYYFGKEALEIGLIDEVIM